MWVALLAHRLRSLWVCHLGLVFGILDLVRWFVPPEEVDLSLGMTAEALQPILSDGAFVEKLAPFLPQTGQTMPPADQLKGTVSSPQFQQVWFLNIFFVHPSPVLVRSCTTFSGGGLANEIWVKQGVHRPDDVLDMSWILIWCPGYLWFVKFLDMSWIWKQIKYAEDNWLNSDKI